MKLVRIAAATLFALFLANCSMDISVEDLTGPDFLNSKVISQTEGLSDGLTDLVVIVELRNSDNTLEVNHTPTLVQISGIAVSLMGCSASDANGHSTCRIRASAPGTATVAFGNILIDLMTDVEFKPPRRDGNFMQIVSAALNKVNTITGGYSVTAHVGAPFAGLVQEVPDGSGGFYKVYTNTTAGITPAED